MYLLPFLFLVLHLVPLANPVHTLHDSMMSLFSALSLSLALAFAVLLKEMFDDGKFIADVANRKIGWKSAKASESKMKKKNKFSSKWL